MEINEIQAKRTTEEIRVRDGYLMNLPIIQTVGENTNLDLDSLL